MATVPKIDSNITGLAYAQEAQLGLLPGEGGLAGSPVWYRLEPNTYSDFGGEVVTVAPNPINPSRQRRKGVITDLNANGGFNHNITFTNLSDLMQGVMFADIRKKAEQVATDIAIVALAEDEYGVAETAGFLVGSLIIGRGFQNSANNALKVVSSVTLDSSVNVDEGTLVPEVPSATANIKVVGHEFAVADVSIVVTGNLPTMISGSSFDFTTLGLVPGQWVFIGGDVSTTRFVSPANNDFKRVRSVTATEITFDKSDQPMVAEVSTGLGIRLFFGDALRNETGSLIKRRTYNVERLLGAPDDSLPNQIQSEVLIGAVPNEFTLNIPQAELANIDVTFVATDNTQREATVGPKQTGVLTFPASEEYNTSSDIGRLRLSTVSDIDEAPAALFAFVTEASIAINNNVTPNKAVGVLGSFDVTAGTFTVSGSLTAYFSNVAATQAVRNNASVSLDVSFVKNNTAIVYDLPLLSLGDGRLNIEIDQPITLPLTTDAASGETISSDLNHTLLITYFNYVPNVAL